jgi:hypothetical protein
MIFDLKQKEVDGGPMVFDLKQKKYGRAYVF